MKISHLLKLFIALWVLALSSKVVHTGANAKIQNEKQTSGDSQKAAYDNENIKSTNFIYTITIDSGITPYILEYIQDAVKSSSKNGAKLLLVYLDTPGGLLNATRDIVQTFLASPIPIAVYVSPRGARAGSAGVFITMAAHIAAMAPSTNIGAAKPVSMMGGDVEGDMKSKIESDASAWARSIAETRGRNAEWAEKAVRKAESITAKEALKLNVIDVIAKDSTHLLSLIQNKKITLDGKEKTLDVKGAELIEFPLSAKQQLMQYLSDPNLIYILLLLGVLGVFIEFQSPGLIIPGLLGGVCLLTVFAVQVLPINWFGALLILAAALFFVAEIFITSFGLLSVGGLTLLILGSYLLFDVQGSTFFVEPALIWTVSILFFLLIIAVGYFLVRAKAQGPTSNVDALKGETAKVTKKITPNDEGYVLLKGTYWQALSKVECKKGDEVKVVGVKNTKVFVEPITKD